jgi:6-phosphogluconate dehydrogenase
VGVIGLDAIGRNVILHLADQHFNVAAYDADRQKALGLREQFAAPELHIADDLADLLASLTRPREILIFSGHDAPIDLVIEQLLPQLEPGDLLMDDGESYFKDTATLDRRLAGQNIPFMGVGLGGGETGARHGAIIMSGGGQPARQRSSPLLEAMAATIRGEACVCSFETAAAAHFAKMVHTGIEFAIFELLAETFGLLQRAAPGGGQESQDPSGLWCMSLLNGYLMELTGRPLEPVDKQTPRLVLNEKLQAAKSGHLGAWITQSAWELEIPIPTIEASVAAPRVPSEERRRALRDAAFRQPAGRLGDDPRVILDELHGAFHAAMLIAYAQGVSLLSAGSVHHGFDFKLHEITRAWRGCTRLRTGLLDDITTALETTPDLPGILCDDDLSQNIMDSQEHLRRAVWHACQLDMDVPALMASLDAFDSDRSAWLPVNLIEAPRRETADAPAAMA